MAVDDDATGTDDTISTSAKDAPDTVSQPTTPASWPDSPSPAPPAAGPATPQTPKRQTGSAAATPGSRGTPSNRKVKVLCGLKKPNMKLATRVREYDTESGE